MKKNRKKINRIKIIFFLLVVFQINGKCQILIGGKGGNTIYSSVGNLIEYIGKHDCHGMSARIEGYKEKINIENCVFNLTYLIFDTSRLEIVNDLDEVRYETILLKNRNRAKAYLKVGNKLLIDGSITKAELKFLDKIKVKYECPWITEPKIFGFNIVVINEKGRYISYKISGNKIPSSYKEKIILMDNPKLIYIEGINWNPLHCSDVIDDIVLKIE